MLHGNEARHRDRKNPGQQCTSFQPSAKGHQLSTEPRPATCKTANRTAASIYRPALPPSTETIRWKVKVGAVNAFNSCQADNRQLQDHRRVSQPATTAPPGPVNTERLGCLSACLTCAGRPASTARRLPLHLCSPMRLMLAPEV